MGTKRGLALWSNWSIPDDLGWSGRPRPHPVARLFSGEAVPLVSHPISSHYCRWSPSSPPTLTTPPTPRPPPVVSPRPPHPFPHALPHTRPHLPRVAAMAAAFVPAPSLAIAGRPRAAAVSSRRGRPAWPPRPPPQRSSTLFGRRRCRRHRRRPAQTFQAPRRRRRPRRPGRLGPPPALPTRRAPTPQQRCQPRRRPRRRRGRGRRRRQPSRPCRPRHCPPPTPPPRRPPPRTQGRGLLCHGVGRGAAAALPRRQGGA